VTTSPVTTAVVPLRDGVSGKSRLAGELDPAARRRLVAALARHVVEVLAAAPGLDRVLVVTADVAFVRETLAGLLDRVPGRVTVVEQPGDRPGLNAALDVAREHVATGERPASRLLVVHADLPGLTVGDLGAVLGTEARVVVATDRHAAGTNLLLVPLAQEPFRFRFGPGSRAAHLAEADRLGLSTAVVRRPGTAADLDTIDDWDELPREVRARVRAAVGHPLP
jgi:2-phospho-L-lactate guanylyltransferase